MGNDCKYGVPPFKLTQEMRDGIGNKFTEFVELTTNIYIELRKHSKEILNLFNLMTNAKIS